MEGLAKTSSDIDEFSFSKPIKKFASRSGGSFLETIPSFSFHKSSGKYEDDSEYEEDEGEEDNLENQEQQVNDSIRNDVNNSRFGFNEEMKYVSAYANTGLQGGIHYENSQMYLARGLRIFGVDMNFGGGNGSYGGNGCFGGGSRSGDGDEKDLEKHYTKMVQDNPGNPLCLRNYAQFLYQVIFISVPSYSLNPYRIKQNTILTISTCYSFCRLRMIFKERKNITAGQFL